MTNPIITREAQRYVTHVDGHMAVIDFRQTGTVLDAYHTGVPDAIAGRGIAGALVRYMLTDARARGERVRPSCSYVAAWLRRHPEFDDVASPL